MNLIMTLKTMMNKVVACMAAVLMVGLPGASAFAADAATDTTKDAATTTNVAQVTTASGATTSYTSVKDAFAAATAGSTITLLADSDLPAYSSSGTTVSLEANVPFTLEGNGHTLTVHGRGIYLTGSSDESAPSEMAMNHVTIVNPDAAGRVVSARDGYKTLTFNDVMFQTTGTGNTQVFTLGGNTPQTTDVTFRASSLIASSGGYGIITFNPIDLTLSDTMVSGYAALYLKGPMSSAGSSDSIVNVTNGSVLTSTGIAGSANKFGTIVFEQVEGVQVTIENSTVSTNADSGEPATIHAIVDFSSSTGTNGAIATNNTVTFGEGSKTNAFGENSVFIEGNGTANTVNAEDGTYDLQGTLFASSASADDAAAGTSLVVTGGTWNQQISAYVPEGYTESTTSDGKLIVTPNDELRDADGADDSTDESGTEVSGPVTNPTQPAQGADPNASQAATNVATPPNSQNADEAITTAGASIQQTGDSLMEGLVVALGGVIIVACSLMLYHFRKE